MRRAGAAALALLLGAGAAAAQGDTARAVRPRTAYEDLQMFSQVLNQIRVNHPDSVDTHELFMAAVEGMVNAADPHSYVIRAARLSPQRERDFAERRIYPVPIDWSYFGGSPVVAAVAPGSEAARQDILPGDLLVSIDGQPVRAESSFELDVTLAGPRNSTVTLGLERRRSDGSLARLQRTVKRQRVAEATTVPVAFTLDATTGYVRITSFDSDKTAEDFHAALERLDGLGIQRLVVDLRDNGGGIVDEASKVAGEFLPGGSVVYRSRGRKAETNDEVKVRRIFSSQRRWPMVLLVNEGSASASELVAGALQDHDRALVVGRPTFGKSLMMRGFPMTDGSVIVLVVGHIETPCGRVVQRQYRDVSNRDYYRMAREARDTAGRPSCRTTGGRTVYGGGGIYPDVVLDEKALDPVWLARAKEDDLLTRWAGGWVTANAASLTTAEDLAAKPTLPAAALEDFRGFARQQGVAVPAGAEADALLQRALLERIALTKWGEVGYYRVSAAMDADLVRAVAEFDQAARILTPAP